MCVCVKYKYIYIYIYIVCIQEIQYIQYMYCVHTIYTIYVMYNYDVYNIKVYCAYTMYDINIYIYIRRPSLRGTTAAEICFNCLSVVAVVRSNCLLAVVNSKVAEFCLLSAFIIVNTDFKTTDLPSTLAGLGFWDPPRNHQRFVKILTSFRLPQHEKK